MKRNLHGGKIETTIALRKAKKDDDLFTERKKKTRETFVLREVTEILFREKKFRMWWSKRTR